jgi:hypothetical protein
LAFDPVAGRELLSDRLEHPDPFERFGVVAAICRFLRPSEASRNGSSVALGYAESGFLGLGAHRQTVAGLGF